MTLCRRLALAVALVACAGYPVGQWFASPGGGSLDDLSFFGFLAAGAISVVLLAVATLAERPAVFIVRPAEPSFSAPPSSNALGISLVLTVGASGEAGSLVGSVKSHDLPLWDAVVVAFCGRPLRPAARTKILALTYARPELVRRRGLVLGHQLLSIDNVAGWFIADAIRHYVTHPERRAAIGTEAEYGRLLHAIRNELTDPPAGPGIGSNP
ncbi:hypothetical protein [Micromonospora chersina]|uniref:hypothetical protein n=1 Tax=Micromonospora chersina TaxID=47854 RepID=UPI00371EF941